MQDKTVHKAYEDLEKLVMDEGTLRMYEIREKAILDERSNLYAASEEGLQKGLKQGREEGKEETRKMFVDKMIAKGVNDNLICEIAGISKKQLGDLKRELS